MKSIILRWRPHGIALSAASRASCSTRWRKRKVKFSKFYLQSPRWSSTLRPTSPPLSTNALSVRRSWRRGTRWELTWTRSTTQSRVRPLSNLLRGWVAMVAMVVAVRVATSLIPFKCGRYVSGCGSGIVPHLVQLCLNCILRHEICQKKFTPPDFQAKDFTPLISTALVIKHRKNCECCPGHYLIVNHYF